MEVGHRVIGHPAQLQVVVPVLKEPLGGKTNENWVAEPERERD